MKINLSEKKTCMILYSKIADAFHDQSGGDYNDTMYWQWQGAYEEVCEAEEDNDWSTAISNLSKCWAYVKHCKKIDDLKSNMPPEVYC